MTGDEFALAPGAAPASSWRVPALCFLIVMVDGFDSLMVSFIAPVLAHGWRLGPTEIGDIFAVGYLGAIIGAVSMGPLADRYGRKPMLLVAVALAAVATGSCAAAATFSQLVGLRFLCGVALGGALPAAISVTAEHVEPQRRSGAVTAMYIGYPMGGVVGGALTAAFVHFGWRPVFAGTAFACLLALGAASLLPRAPPSARGRPRLAKTMFMEQFADGRLWPALTLWLALFCSLLLTYFLVSWAPSLIAAAGGTAADGVLGGVSLNLGGILGALAIIPLARRFGPYGVAGVVALIGGGLVALFGVAWHPLWSGLLVLFGCGLCIFGVQLNIPAMVVDLFPAPVRGAGGGWTLGFGRIGSIVGPLVGGMLISAHLPFRGLFVIATLPALVAAAAFFLAAKLRAKINAPAGGAYRPRRRQAAADGVRQG